MVIATTIDATVPSGTSGNIIFYEDVNANQDGTQVDANGRAYNNSQTIALEDGTNTYTLDNFAGGNSNEYWFDLDVSNTDRESGLVVNSAEIDLDATITTPGTGTLEWTTETEFNNVRDEIGIATDGLGSHPSAGSAFQGYPYGDLRKELLMYFPFDDNKSTSTAQNAAHGEPGKLNAVSYSTDALVESRSLSFTSAGSSVSIGRYPQAEVEDGVFTASVVFKVDVANVTGDVMLFGDKDISGANDTAGFAIFLGKSNSNVQVKTAVEDDSGTLRTGNTSGTNFGDNSWHVVVLTKTDDNTYDIYVDGNRRYGIGSNGDITSTNDFRVGVAHDGSSNDYRGLIEEVRLYGKAFSQVEAERLYNIRSSDYQTTSNLPSATPTSRYDFEGTGSTATDAQGNNDGTISGATRVTDRVVGSKSIEFDTDSDYVEIPNIVGGTTAWTVSTWVNVNTVGSDSTLVGRWSTNDADKSLLLYWDGSSSYFRALVHSGSSSSSINTSSKDAQFIQDNWVHITITYSTSQFRIYYNGILEDFVDSPVSIQSGTNLYFGSEDADASRRLIGLMDDVRFYDSTLTPTQVERIYNFQQPRLPENSTPETGLNGWLPLNEKAGDAIDLAAGNDGTVNGPTQGVAGLQGAPSYSFDGTDDSIELVNNYYSLPLSVTTWVYNNQADGTRRDIINFRDQLRLIIATGVNGTNTIDVWDGSWTEVGSYTANEWFNVVATIDESGTTKVYVDGQLSAIEELSPTNGNANRNIVGTDPSNNGPWDGRIGEIRTYRRRLRPSEIDLLYRRANPNIEQATTDPNLAKFSGAVSRWSFDDTDTSSGTTIDTYGSNNGTIVNATTGVSGIGEGQAYDFNGTDAAVEIADSTSISNLSQLAISVWVNLDSGGAFQGIVSKGPDVSNTGSTEFKLLVGSNDNVRFAISGGSNETEIVSDSSLVTGDWYHIVAIWDGLNMEIYINGVLNATGTRDSMQDTTSNLLIGANPDGNSGAASSAANFIDAQIDEVRFYSESLDSHQVWQLYSLGRNQNWVTHNE